MSGLLSRPRQYVPYQPANNEEYCEILSNTSKRGKLWLSNKTNFLMEIFKFMPAADAYECEKYLPDPIPGRFKDATLTNLLDVTIDPPISYGGTTYTNYKSYVAGVYLRCVRPREYEFKDNYEQIINNDTNFRSFPSKIKSGIGQLLNTKKQASKVADDYFNDISADQKAFMKYDYEFTPGDEACIERGATEDTRRKTFNKAIVNGSTTNYYGFGYTHRQTLNGLNAGAGLGQILNDDYNFFDGITDYFHTEEDPSKRINRKSNIGTFDQVDFFQSYDEIMGNNKSAYNSVGNLNSAVIPIWSDPDGHNRLTAYTEAGYAAFNPTDYNNQLFGYNPVLGAGNLTDYSSVFSQARNELQGVYSYNRFGTNNNPTFYQLALDPTAPWNNSGIVQSGTWWNEQLSGTADEIALKKGRLAFDLLVLMLESKRRYNSAMTEIFGPATQFATVANDRINNPSGYSSSLDKSADGLMIDHFEKLTGYDQWYKKVGYGYGGLLEQQNGVNPYWRWDESDGYSKYFLQYFLVNSHATTNMLTDMGDNSGFWTNYGMDDRSKRLALVNWIKSNVNYYMGSAATMNEQGQWVSTAPGSFLDRISKADAGEGENTSGRNYRETVNNSYDAYVTAYNAWNSATDEKVKEANRATRDQRYLEFRNRLAGFRGRNESVAISALEMATYKLRECFWNIESAAQGLPSTCPDTDPSSVVTISSVLELFTKLNDEIVNIKTGSAVNELKNEMFGTASAVTGTNKFNLYGRKFDIDTGKVDGTTLAGDHYASSWDFTSGNVMTNVGRGSSGYGTYISAPYTAGETLTKMTGLHHWYSPVAQMSFNSSNWHSEARKMNYTRYSGHDWFQIYNGQLLLDTPTISGSCEVASSNFPYMRYGNPYSEIWMSHQFVGFNEAYNRELYEMIKFGSANSIESSRSRKRWEEYRRKKEEVWQEERMDKKAQNKAINNRKKMNAKMLKASKERRKAAAKTNNNKAA